MNILPNEIILIIFDNIKLITDKRQFLRTCILYNNVTKCKFQQFEKNYFDTGFEQILENNEYLKNEQKNEINKYCVEKFTLELCHDQYFEMIPESYIMSKSKLLQNTTYAEIKHLPCSVPNKTNKIIVKAAVVFNCLPLLIKVRNQCYLITDICTHAARNGNLDMLKWAKNIGEEWITSTYIEAAENGNLDIFKWGFLNNSLHHRLQKGSMGHSWICSAAARGGSLDILKFLLEHQFRLGSNVCASAALNGHLNVLKWARANGCKWDDMTRINAQNHGHLEVLKWAIENGCP